MTKNESCQFKIIDNDSLILLSANSTFYKQIDSNGAIIEKLPDESFIMLPSYGNKGIIFFDKSTMDEMININVYPHETDSGSFYELYKKEILGLTNESANKSILFFENKFKNICQIPFDYTFSIDFLNQLERFIKKNRKDKNKIDDLYISTIILFNEAIRKQIHVEWKYDKQYTLNTFYVPYISDNGIKIEINSSIYDKFYIHSYKLGFKELLITILEDYASQKNQFVKTSLLNKRLNENFEERFFKYLTAIKKNNLQIILI